MCEYNGLKPSPLVFLLICPRRFFCCSSVLLVLRWFHVWHLFWPYVFLISPCCSASEKLCFLIVAFTGYLHLYFCIISSSRRKVFLLYVFQLKAMTGSWHKATSNKDLDTGTVVGNFIIGDSGSPASILHKSIAGRYRPVSYPDGPITARYRFM